MSLHVGVRALRSPRAALGSLQAVLRYFSTPSVQSPPDDRPGDSHPAVSQRGVCSRASREVRIVYESRRADRGPVFGGPHGVMSPSSQAAAAEAPDRHCLSAIPRLRGCGLDAWHASSPSVRIHDRIVESGRACDPSPEKKWREKQETRLVIFPYAYLPWPHRAENHLYSRLTGSEHQWPTSAMHTSGGKERPRCRQSTVWFF